MVAVSEAQRIEGDGTREDTWLAWPGLDDLPRTTASALVPDGCRAVVVAPHPDDEIIACGALMADWARRHRRLAIVAVTDGTASHAGSTLWPASRLAASRPLESRMALRDLGVDVEPQRFGFADGDVAANQDGLARRLGAMLDSSDVVFTTYRLDGHPDHEATARACAQACRTTGARLVEIPVWAWHWAGPEDPSWPWSRAQRIDHGDAVATLRYRALNRFTSQVTPDPSTGAAPILGDGTWRRAARSFDVVFT